MLSLSNIQSLVTTVLMLCAYGFSATVTEAGQAWVAKKAGDDSAAERGWLSLNPFDHVDLVGASLVILLGFSWVRGVPMKIHEPYGTFPSRLLHHIKWLTVYSAQSIVALIVAILALTILTLTFGYQSIPLAFSMFWSACAPLTEFTRLYPARSSLAIIGALFLVSLVVYNVFIASISFIANTFFYLLINRRSGTAFLAAQSGIIIWIVIFVFIIIFSNALEGFFLSAVTHSAFWISRLLGGA